MAMQISSPVSCTYLETKNEYNTLTSFVCGLTPHLSPHNQPKHKCHLFIYIKSSVGDFIVMVHVYHHSDKLLPIFCLFLFHFFFVDTLKVHRYENEETCMFYHHSRRKISLFFKIRWWGLNAKVNLTDWVPNLFIHWLIEWGLLVDSNQYNNQQNWF